jgi:hypothetical protein
MITIPFPLLILAIVILNFWISAQSLIMIWLSAIQYKASISLHVQICIQLTRTTVYPYIVLLYFFWPSLMVKTTRLRFIFTCFQQNTTFVTRILLAASSYNGHRLSKNIRLTLPRVKMWIESKYHSNITSFFRFVNNRASYPFGKISLTHVRRKLCATFSANVNINYRVPIKVYYRICTLRHIRIEINHGSQNVFWVLTWIGGY